MTILNISMPESMHAYVELRAAGANFSPDEYVRQLISEDQRRQSAQAVLLQDYLALAARQLEEGDIAHVTLESLLAQGRERRAAGV